MDKENSKHNAEYSRYLSQLDIKAFEKEIKSLKKFEHKKYLCEVKYNNIVHSYTGYIYLQPSNKYFSYSLSKLNKVIEYEENFDDSLKEKDTRRIGFIFREHLLSDRALGIKIMEDQQTAIDVISGQIKKIIDKLENYDS